MRGGETMKQKGFTLVELLVVIAIIGILSTVAIINLQGAKDKAEQANVVAALSQLSSAVILCHDDNNQLISGGADSICDNEADDIPTAGGDVCTNSTADWPTLESGWTYKTNCNSVPASDTWSVGACVGAAGVCTSGGRAVDCDNTGCTTGFSS